MIQATQQHPFKPVNPLVIYADVERVLFEEMLKKWTLQITPAKTQRRKKWLTQKEVAETWGLSERTLEQLRRQNVGFKTKIVKGIVCYNRQAIEKYCALIRFQPSNQVYAPPCTLTARNDFSQRHNKKRMCA